MLNYESAQCKLPPARVSNAEGRIIFGNSNRSVFVFLLPYFEEQAIAELFVLGTGTISSGRRNWSHSDNQPMFQKQIPTLQCPSTPENPRLVSGKGSDLVDYSDAGSSDYAPLYEILHQGVNSPVTLGLITLQPERRHAMLEVNISRKFKDATDGTTKCLMFSEVAGRPTYYDARRSIVTDASGNAQLVKGGAWADN